MGASRTSGARLACLAAKQAEGVESIQCHCAHWPESTLCFGSRGHSARGLTPLSLVVRTNNTIRRLGQGRLFVLGAFVFVWQSSSGRVCIGLTNNMQHRVLWVQSASLRRRVWLSRVRSQPTPRARGRCLPQALILHAAPAVGRGAAPRLLRPLRHPVPQPAQLLGSRPGPPSDHNVITHG